MAEQQTYPKYYRLEGGQPARIRGEHDLPEAYAGGAWHVARIIPHADGQRITADEADRLRAAWDASDRAGADKP
jgi:hypothetical protein